MKKLFYSVIFLITVVSISCERDIYKNNEETGNLHIDVGLYLNIHEIGGQSKSTPLLSDIEVFIFRADGTPVMDFANAMEMPDTIELATGDYYVEAHTGNNLPAAFENAYFYGASEVFTVSSNMQQSVQINCRLSNTIVTVEYSENIQNSFSDYSTTVSSELGSLVFSKTETRLGYFKTSPLDILVELSYLKPDGSVVDRSLSGNIPAPLANRHYQIAVDASINEGMASFQILLDGTEVPIDIVGINEDTDSLPDGNIGYGDLLITEIMYDPSALSDTEGEWFEIYNNSDQEINLQNLILGRDETNWHTINDSIVLQPGDYFVFMRTALASDAANSYVYGTAITLSNTGAVLSIYGEGTETSPGELIFSVGYGAGFPSGTGASICLNPTLMNPADAVLGTSWCKSTSVYNTGDLGTPGSANDACQ